MYQKLYKVRRQRHHEDFYQFIKKPISKIPRLSINLIQFQIKYAAKRVAENVTFLCRCFIVFETKGMKIYRFLDRTLFGDTAWLYIFNLTRLNISYAIFKINLKMNF